ncbi:MAG: hypothetical protein HY645_01475, partial [Acidobacteria bacterium]|nr:hypothetical protein [Acidobacteriota bacterium]
YQTRARYYDAVTARFISREPLWPRIVDPRQLNSYQYAALNPVTKVDFTGLDPQETDAAQVSPKLPNGGTGREDPQGIRKLYDDYEVSLGPWFNTWVLSETVKYTDSIENDVRKRNYFELPWPEELRKIVFKARRLERDIRIFRAQIGQIGANIWMSWEERTEEREALETQIRERSARYESLEKRFKELTVKHFGQEGELGYAIYGYGF